VADGWVYCAEYREEDGNTIIIQHEADLRTIYCHLEAMLVSGRQEVGRGEVIALSGNTGRLTGDNPHLHFQVNVWYGWGSPTNPYPSYWYGGKGRPLAYDPNFNGFTRK
jgi:murein DD-endopeptidase MepM/ murein hydrolase activator NlpD